ncbi:MAG: polyphosphate--glucose phosphotransferase [Saprospiraceae bacterium]
MENESVEILGIDVGASGIKGALVDLQNGRIKGDRFRVPTPQPATPAAVAEAFCEIADFFGHKGPVGCGFPSIVKSGVALSAANIDDGWIGQNIETTLGGRCGLPVFALNDADAAGLAEMRYGAGHGRKGLVFLITVGTGLGTAIFNDGVLIPNTELGHLMWRQGQAVETWCSSGARERLKISRAEWAERFNEYLLHLERLFSPDLFIIGGGESKYFDTFKAQLHTQAEVLAARLLNNAGIIGAGLYAQQQYAGQTPAR